MKNGITLILTEPLSEKAKDKLRKLSENQKKHLEQMKNDFEEGKYDDIISQLKNEQQLFLITLKGLVLRGLCAKYFQPRKTKPMLAVRFYK